MSNWMNFDTNSYQRFVLTRTISRGTISSDCELYLMLGPVRTDCKSALEDAAQMSTLLWKVDSTTKAKERLDFSNPSNLKYTHIAWTINEMLFSIVWGLIMWHFNASIFHHTESIVGSENGGSHSIEVSWKWHQCVIITNNSFSNLPEFLVAEKFAQTFHLLRVDLKLLQTHTLAIVLVWFDCISLIQRNPEAHLYSPCQMLEMFNFIYMYWDKLTLKL